MNLNPILFPFFLALLTFASCKPDYPPYDGCEDAYSFVISPPSDDYVERCGGCHEDLIEFNEMCFYNSDLGLLGLTVPHGCRKGERVLLSSFSDGSFNLFCIYASDRPKRKLHENLFHIRDVDSLEYYIARASAPVLATATLDCDETDSLSFYMMIDKETLHNKEYNQIPAEIIWYEGDALHRKDEVLLHRFY